MKKFIAVGILGKNFPLFDLERQRKRDQLRPFRCLLIRLLYFQPHCSALLFKELELLFHLFH